MQELDADYPPEREEPEDWEHYELYRRVRRALLALPAHFESETHISGIQATDLHTLGPVVGATIEEEVTDTLNAMRDVWDPDDNYSLYNFVRQPQTFPDVLLKRPGDAQGDEILLGIELKHWYLMAKEGEPNLRYRVTREACNPWDLFVTVPWVLGQVLTGTPTVMTPYVELGRYVADYRGYYWQEERNTELDRTILKPEDVQPYPEKTEEIQDRAVEDSGNNFGRIARTGVMDEYVETIKHRSVNGITIDHWLTFFQAFREGRSHEEISEELEQIGARIHEELETDEDRDDAIRQILDAVDQLVD